MTPADIEQFIGLRWVGIMVDVQNAMGAKEEDEMSPETLAALVSASMRAAASMMTTFFEVTKQDDATLEVYAKVCGDQLQQLILAMRALRKTNPNRTNN